MHPHTAIHASLLNIGMFFLLRQSYLALTSKGLKYLDNFDNGQFVYGATEDAMDHFSTLVDDPNKELTEAFTIYLKAI